jgi:hypothetical protein
MTALPARNQPLTGQVYGGPPRPNAALRCAGWIVSNVPTAGGCACVICFIGSRAGNAEFADYFVYHHNFWPRDPYFAWFEHWLKGEPTGIMDEPAVYYSPRAWVDDREAYSPAEWRYAELWPPPEARLQRLYLRGDSTLGADGRRCRGAPTPSSSVRRSRCCGR